MEDKNELKIIALRNALDLAVVDKNKTTDTVVDDAKKFHDFLVKEDDNKDTG